MSCFHRIRIPGTGLPTEANLQNRIYMESNKYSKTAAYVAIKFYGLTLSNPFNKLFDDEVIAFYDRLVVQLPSPLNNYHALLQKSWFRNVLMYFDEKLLPGDLLHILMRKFYLQRIIERLTEKEYSQIIILGAGFDHLGSTYSRNGIPCFELDVTATAHIKQQFLDRYGYTNNHLTVYPANLSHRSLYEVLTEIPSLDSEAKTVVIAEGFFDYLRPEVFSLTLNEFFSNSLKLVSTVFSLQELNRFHAFVFRNAIKAAGEDLKLHASRDDYKHYLKKHHFQIDHILTADEMRDGILLQKVSEMAILPGFYILEASRSR